MTDTERSKAEPARPKNDTFVRIMFGRLLFTVLAAFAGLLTFAGTVTRYDFCVWEYPGYCESIVDNSGYVLPVLWLWMAVRLVTAGQGRLAFAVLMASVPLFSLMINAISFIETGGVQTRIFQDLAQGIILIVCPTALMVFAVFFPTLWSRFLGIYRFSPRDTV